MWLKLFIFLVFKGLIVMRKVLSICVALACLASGVPAAAQDAVVKRIIEIGKTEAHVQNPVFEKLKKLSYLS